MEPVVGSIWERDDELFIVEHVYEASTATSESTRAFRAWSAAGEHGVAPQIRYEPVTLVKFRCIDPMPNHTHLENFLEHYKLYDPEADDDDDS